MGEIKAVTFDVGGTLAKGRLNAKLYQSKVLEYLRRSGFEVKPGDYRRATGKALGELNRRREERLEMSYDEFCSAVLHNLGVAPSQELLGGVERLYFECFPQAVRRGARRMLAGLSKGYELGAISNSMSLVPKRFLEASGLARYLKVIVISGEVGYRKPHPAIFKRALEGLGAEPEEAVHVGNSIEEDVAGARGIGMHPVLVSPSAIGETQPEPDFVVPSVKEVPGAIAALASPELREIKGLLGNRCGLCSSLGVGLYKIDPKGGEEVDNFVPLCPRCYRETLKKPPRARKRGKYRAIYRRAWLELRMPKGRG